MLLSYVLDGTHPWPWPGRNWRTLFLNHTAVAQNRRCDRHRQGEACRFERLSPSTRSLPYAAEAGRHHVCRLHGHVQGAAGARTHDDAVRGHGTPVDPGRRHAWNARASRSICDVLRGTERPVRRIKLATLEGRSARRMSGREFNIGSPKQLGDILFNELKIAGRASKTKTGDWSTDSSVHGTADGIRKRNRRARFWNWRQLSKLKKHLYRFAAERDLAAAYGPGAYFVLAGG